MSGFINYILWGCLFVSVTAVTTSFDSGTAEQGPDELNNGYFENYHYYEPELKDWSFYNYSSNEWYARNSIVSWGGKTYDPLSFKGGVNDSHAIAFYLSTEVAVSAAQCRDGRVFDVAQVNGSDSYKAFMSRVQQDLKGDRSSYYTEINYPHSGGPFFYMAPEYPKYFKRIYKYLTDEETPVIIPDAQPIFTEILSSLQNATEESLGAKMNTSEGFYAQGKIYIYMSAPWEFNRTTSEHLRRAMKDLNMTMHYGNYRLDPQPWAPWHNHSSDERDYSGDNGSAMASQQARELVEMMEYDPTYRYGDFICGTPYVMDAMRVEEEMKANGTWVEPLRKNSVDWMCTSWRECLTAWPWGF